MSWDRVARWVDALKSVDPGAFGGLSPEGAKEAYRAALAPLSPQGIAELEGIPGAAWPRAVVVAAGTVATAPIEWCAALLGRGSTVVVKHPSDDPGLAPLLVEAAQRVGLPLTATADREIVGDADFVVVMGSDETVREIAQKLPSTTRYEPHGHRFSVAWVTGKPVEPDALVPPAFQGSWEGVAADAALHDGRGCLSPLVVFTPLPVEHAADRLSAALTLAQQAWPVGQVAPAEHAAARSREALARAVGTVRRGVHVLPVVHFTPIALPRSLMLVHVDTVGDAIFALRPWRAHLSTVGTDDPETAPAWLSSGASRVCRVGRMQRPPLLRIHDGVDWVRSTIRS